MEVLLNWQECKCKVNMFGNPKYYWTKPSDWIFGCNFSLDGTITPGREFYDANPKGLNDLDSADIGRCLSLAAMALDEEVLSK